MYKEIGSNFWLKDYPKYIENIDLNFLEMNYEDIKLLSTGRSAIKFILKQLELSVTKKIALLPVFTCDTVIKPFLDMGYTVNFIEIEENLEIFKGNLLKKIKETDPSIILFHEYFGFNTFKNINTIIQDLRKQGIKIIQDLTQSMYSKFRYIDSDYYIGSLRKWGPLPDGAFAISNYKKFLTDEYIENEDKELVYEKVNAFIMKYDIINKNVGNKDQILKLFALSEEKIDNQYNIYFMSKQSKYIQSKFDINNLVLSRRKNYKYLLKSLKNLNFLNPIFNSIEEDVTPLYFPIYIYANRQNFQKYLSENNIYAPVIWPKPSMVDLSLFKSSKKIYENILAIPCDQRYGVDEMNYISNIILKYK